MSSHIPSMIVREIPLPVAGEVFHLHTGRLIIRMGRKEHIIFGKDWIHAIRGKKHKHEVSVSVSAMGFDSNLSNTLRPDIYRPEDVPETTGLQPIPLNGFVTSKATRKLKIVGEIRHFEK